MPMRPELYPRDWPAIALARKQAANWTCEQCGAVHGQRVLNRRGELVDVQIGVAHVNHDTWNPRAELRVLCRRCHVLYDARDGKRKRVQMAIARGQLVLPRLGRLYRSPRRRRR